MPVYWTWQRSSCSSFTTKKNFDCNLLYSNTDSFLYEVRSRDFFVELQWKKLVAAQFDFSNFPPEHPLYSRENARVTLKFKDEMGREPIAEFCGLKPELYSIKLAEGKYKSFTLTHIRQTQSFNKNQYAKGIQVVQVFFRRQESLHGLQMNQCFIPGPAKQSAKGVTKDVRRSMTHELYKRTLLGNEEVRLLDTRVSSSNHRLHTIVVNKKSMSGYDDKRFIMSDQVSMLPYGHRSIRKDIFFKSIMNEPDWGADDSGESEQKSVQQAQESGQQAQDNSQQVKKTKTSKKQAPNATVSKRSTN